LARAGGGFNAIETVTIAMPIDEKVIRRIASPRHDPTGHLGVDRAEVLVRPGRNKAMGELFVGIEHRRLELLLGTDDGVWYVVSIVQVMVVPTGTDGVAGVKLKLSITTSWAVAVCISASSGTSVIAIG
jgi:hypothetical protein